MARTAWLAGLLLASSPGPVLAGAPGDATATPAASTPRTFSAAPAGPHDPATQPGEDVLRLGGDGVNRMTVSVDVANTLGEHAAFAFLVDTGAERTVVARSIASSLHLAANAHGELVGMAGVRMVDLVNVATLNLGKRSLYDLESPVLDAEAIGADGIVGLDGLQGQRVLLDFQHSRLVLGDAAHAGGDNGFEIVVEARRKSGQLIMTDAMVDGVHTAVVIDTGSDISVGNAALGRALAHGRDPRGTVELRSVTGQTAKADLVLADSIEMGGMTLHNTVIAFTDAPPFARLGLARRPALLLGMDQLRLFNRVAIDFARRRILFAMPKQG